MNLWYDVGAEDSSGSTKSFGLLTDARNKSQIMREVDADDASDWFVVKQLLSRLEILTNK